jgi:phosphohistidine phosphatase
MRVYLVQHGQAHEQDVDPERHLTERGVEDITRLAAFVRPLALHVAAVWHSGKARAVQTASLLAPALADTVEIEQRAGLAPNDPVEPVAEQIAGTGHDLIIVGHMPFLGKLASTLVFGNSSVKVAIFRQGGLVCLEQMKEGDWRICWMVIPELLSSSGP